MSYLHRKYRRREANLFRAEIYTQSLRTKAIISYSSTDTKYVLINQSAAIGHMQMKWHQSGQDHLGFFEFFLY